MDADPQIQMGTSENAWMVGIIAMAAVVGSPVAGRVIDLLGRRTTILIMCPVTLIGWVTMALAPNLALVLTGRAICGASTAFLFSAVPVYCSEAPEARLRGRLGSLSSLFITFGVVWSYITGAFFPWRISCYLCAAPCILTTAAMLFVPESPYWLLLKGRREDAEAALQWLRGPNYDLFEEITEMEAKLTSVGRKVEFRELWRPRTRKPFLLALFMMTLQQGSGCNILMMYTGTIFSSAGVVNVNMAVLYTGLVQIAGTLFSVLLMDHAGRRPMIVLSTFVMGTSTVTLGVYYYMYNVVGEHGPSWVPLATILVSVFGYCLGSRTIPWLFATELFNTTIRSTANSVTFFYNRILNFIIIQIYPHFEEATGAHTVFFFYGGVCLICCLISFLFVPETKGKTLEQIQEYFERKSNTNTTYSAESIDNRQTACVSTSNVPAECNNSLPTASTHTLGSETEKSISVESIIDKPTGSDEEEIEDKSFIENTKL
ncbi:facilitated trehalose transporter Tret1-like isoform X2 [Homarus americanus]|nr:facilitated trehalose transporter Tret1-like isoform X2 [Homarus americanus]